MIQLGNELHYLAAYSCYVGTRILENLDENTPHLYRVVNDDPTKVSSGCGHWSKKALSHIHYTFSVYQRLKGRYLHVVCGLKILILRCWNTMPDYGFADPDSWDEYLQLP
jgi:hypothetical protein